MYFNRFFFVEPVLCRSALFIFKTRVLSPKESVNKVRRSPCRVLLSSPNCYIQLQFWSLEWFHTDWNLGPLISVMFCLPVHGAALAGVGCSLEPPSSHYDSVILWFLTVAYRSSYSLYCFHLNVTLTPFSLVWNLLLGLFSTFPRTNCSREI